MKHLNTCRPLMLLVAFCLLAVTASAQLSGTYTIGGTSPNYATLSAAVADLNSQGVSGPVVFNIRDGNYTDQVVINSVAGASATNRIVFQSESNNAANVTITASAMSTSNNHIFKLNSAKYVTIRQLTLTPTNGTYCTAINITGAASYDSVVNCNLSGPSSTYTGYYGALVQAYSSAASNMVFKNNNITNGGSGFYIYQSSVGAAQNDFVIEGNNISGQYYMPIYTTYTRDFKIRNNTITKVGPYSYSIYCNYANDAYECTGNVINISNCSYSGYGLYHGNCEGSATDPTKRPLVANNQLTQTGISTTTYPIWNNGSIYLTFRDNTINVSAISTTYIYNQTTPGLVFTGNNITINSSTTVYAYYTYQSHGAVVDSNTINISTGSGSYYPYLMYSDNTKVSNNTVNVTSTSGSIYGFYPQYTSNNTNLELSGNKINVSSTSGTVYGVYVSGTTGTPDMGLRVFNNVITTSTSGTNRSFYATSLVGNNKFYNNTFHSRATGSTNYSFQISPSSGTNTIYNNIFSRTGTNGFLASIGNAGLSAMDNNLYYASSGNILESSSTTAAYNNLQGWRTSTGKDKNSLVYDPGYISATSGNVNDLAPDPASANSWSRNGRGIHIAGNDKDINGNTRVIDRPSGVPDIGAHEFTPTSTPPVASASPASPVASGTQTFTLGQDTVATIAWGASVPSSVTVRQYTGTAPAGISAVSSNNMYFYTDVNVPSGTFAHTSNIYYQDPWAGSTGNEASLRLAKKDGANPWIVYAAGVSSANTTRNIITTTGSSNFGLHTGVDQGDNAGTNALTNPVAPFCSGNQTVIAQIKNSGNNVLNSVQVGWSVDGIVQSPVSYTTQINTLGSGLGNTATVSLGTVNFGTAPKVIRVWTYSPNGNTDPFTNDDTLTVSLRSSLSGTYTIGGTTPNYSNIAAAVTDLNNYGVCGPVVFDIRNGTYTERTVLKPVTGASAINTITFKSETNNAANVTINYSSSSSANYIFLMDSARHFIFRDLTIQTLNTTYGRVFEFKGDASHDSIINCTLTMAGTSGSSRTGIYAISPFNGTGNVMKGSTVNSGYYGVYLSGSSSGLIADFTFDNNTFTNPYSYGLYAYYTNGIKFTNNTITWSGSATFYAGYLYYCHGALDFSGNNITASSTGSSLYGIYANYSNGPSGNYAKFNNNNLTLNNTYTYGYIYPLYFTSINYDSIAGNTVNATGNYYIYNYYQNAGSHDFVGNTLNFTCQYYYGSWYNLANVNMENNDFTFTAPNYMYWSIQTLNNLNFKKNKVVLTCTNSSATTYMYYPSNMVFEDNEWTANGLYTVYALYLYGGQSMYQNNLINRNVIKANATNGTAYGIYAYYNDGFTYSNNIIIAKGQSNYAFYSYNPFDQNLYNNTLVCKNASGYVLQAYNSGSSNGQPYFMKLRNNIFYNSNSSGSGLNFQSGDLTNLNSDYNNVFVGGSSKFVGGGTFSTLSQWRIAKGQDMNSIMYDPGFTNPSSDNYIPDVANSSSWSLNGRGVHITGNDKDFAGNTRVVTKAAGVPDIGAYEFAPTSTPPSAAATPASPAAGTTQVFTLGEDTVATVTWDASASVPSTIDVKQYSGVQPPSFIAANSMYLYTDIAASSAMHDVKIYYKDPQTGTTIGESGLRLVKKDGGNPWTVFSNPQSSTNPVLNFNNSTAMTTFGLHTMTDVPNNASAAELVAPVTAFCAPSTQEVKVKIKNNGNNVLNSVKIGWTKNGAPQTTISYTTPIYTLGSAQGNEAIISLGNVTFPNSNAISFVVYTFNPNNVADPATSDDTLKFTIKPSLNGTYTIGGTTPDYPTVVDAINDLNSFGICGPVVFNIRDGNYTDGGKIDAPLQGSSAVNRVTFQSESGVTANVVITHAASNANNNAVFGLDNISNITVRNLKLVTTNGSFSTAIAMGGSASYDSVVGCILQAPTSGSSGANAAVVQGYYPSFSGTENVLLKNTIIGGYYGIYWNSGGAATKNIVDSNTLSGQYYYGMSLYYTYGTKVRGNTLTLSSPVYYGVDMMYNYAAGTTSSDFIGNTVNATGPVYPIRLYYLNQGGSNTVRGKFAGNTINGSGSTVYCYMYNPYYTDMYNNKINLNSTGYVNNYFGYAAQYTNVYNNEIKVNGTYGYAWYASSMYYSNIYNNAVIGNFGSLSTAYGMYASYGQYDSIYNNTILMTSTYSSSYALYAYLYSSSYSNNWMRNNLIANFSTSTSAYSAYLSPGIGYNNTFDYNNYYASNGNHIYNGMTSQVQTLQAWRTYSGVDKNSLCYNPGVISATGDAHPNANDSASWSLNGRGMHIATNNADLEGNARVTTLAAGVPDIGAYEFVPNSTPPLAIATPAVPAVGKQVFTFGQDTVAVLDWKPNSQIPNVVDIRQYTGTVPPSFPANVGFMYFYTDVNAANSTYDFTADIYYDDPWRGTIPTEANIRMVKKLNPQPWQAYNSPLSSVDVNRNIIQASMTNLGYMTGIEDGTLFSAIITPGGSGIFCPGGSVVLNANTGIGYTYQWQFNYVDIPGATGSSYTATGAGDYTVKITNSANVTATSLAFLVTIVAPPAAQVSASGPLTYCTGGNLTLNAATAVNQTYQWYLNGNLIPSATQPTYQVNTHGSYTVMVKGMGCSSTSPVVTVSEGPIQVNLGQDTSFCEGTPFVLDAGYPGAKYLWSTGDTTQQITIYNKLQSGTYTVAVDAGPNCKGSDNIIVTVNPLPAVLGISYVKNGSTYQFSPSGPTDVKNYLWMFSDNTTDTAKTATHTFSIPEFEVKLVVFNDCGTDTAMLKLPVSVGETANGDVQFTVYPNPASDYITLTSTGDVKFSDVVIINAVGQVVYRGNADLKQKEEVNVGSFANGHYLIRATTAAGMTISKPFNVVR
ncbi:right-handed parallel beta-helix repeat-containing protein [Polluticoccus soli]|uniref:right-handed parallel beta-helix repeat-containing protein n=1 Tax=Polluticoccus soli TaxID=3034150 RepID=UPI0023E2CD5C|nr:right-handed parallel beta-helix repeat-containing protein [Flavipsychrobacter sp. JY13-12]